MKKNTALIETDSPLTLAEEFGFDPKENLKAIGNIEFPIIKIVHGTNQIFTISGEPVKTFEAIILYLHRANAWWKNTFVESGGGDPPDCFSRDGDFPAPGCPNKQPCFNCVNNKYGTNGDGKACKNIKVLYLLLPDNVLPYKLIASATSLKSIDGFLSILTGKKKTLQLMNIIFSLIQEKSKTGIPYSVLVLTPKEEITDRETAKNIRLMLDSFQKQMNIESIIPTLTEVNHG